MNRLNEQFSDQIDMFYLDIDVDGTSSVMADYHIRDRSTYVLLDADGAEITRWVGPLSYGGMASEIESALSASQ
ncbi:MAG: hypothetical protein GY803_28580 [Chloroflexi bacterium]|nr:hypothetical protein [Chloroflexota bacterium]